MRELLPAQVPIADAFWSPRLTVNATRAIHHQWEQLEATLCLDNFRIAAGEKEGFREGWFFADSDAYKWLDAASRILAVRADPDLMARVDALIELIARAQLDDGYLFTYNQIHFPGQRWVNLQIEHELYCLGHLIEAGVSHYLATGGRSLLDLCLKAADLLVRDFLDASVDKTCGHEEIELALIRLYRVTLNEKYLELARQFIERRGRMPFYGLDWYRQQKDHERRTAYVRELRQDYLAKHPEHRSFRLPGDNYAKMPSFRRKRYRLNAWRGFYTQQHAPIRRQTVPVGHSVRFGYLETAVAMLCRERPDATLAAAMEQVWEHMVTRRMYVTGGLGSAPHIEGFGSDYDLDPEYAYAETCAALASLFWNWELALLTGEARYSDLFEWQLYNAANVGMGVHGDTYLYNNPLEVHQGVTRQGWYVVPCCPSNLSRTFADLGKYLYSYEDRALWIHQYVSSELQVNGVSLKVESGLPWSGRVRIQVKPDTQRELTLHVRRPAWAEASAKPSTASGYDPRPARYETLSRDWHPEGEVIELDFAMPIRLRRAHPRVRGHAGRVAVTRGPLVYCLESVDNAGVDIFSAQLDAASLQEEFLPDVLGGCVVIHGRTVEGRPLRFIPYCLWANRGPSQMTVWVHSN